MNEEQIKKAETHLSSVDSVMNRLIGSFGPLEQTPREDHFMSLASSIVSQQVSVAAARSIFARFKQGTALDPQRISRMDIDSLREFGLSRQKASYLIDLSSHFVADKDVFEHLAELEDERVIEELTSVKGIGEWTAQMFLISTLNRTDVFAPADVGLQRAIQLHYADQNLEKPHEFRAFAVRWKPYRTVASLYLWKSLDNDPND